MIQGCGVQHKSYLFFYREDGTLKQLRQGHWQSFLSGELILADLLKTEVCTAQSKFAELCIASDGSKPQRVESFHSWLVSTDQQGRIIDKSCQSLPEATIDQSLRQVFAAYPNLAEQLLSNYFDDLLTVSPVNNIDTPLPTAKIQC